MSGAEQDVISTDLHVQAAVDRSESLARSRLLWPALVSREEAAVLPVLTALN